MPDQRTDVLYGSGQPPPFTQTGTGAESFLYSGGHIGNGTEHVSQTFSDWRKGYNGIDEDAFTAQG